MAYFSNGSEGDYYEHKFCDRCVHQGDSQSEQGCPVWLLHLTRNYEECNNPLSFLNVLWPRNKDGTNGDCQMFIEKPSFEQGGHDAK